MMAAATQPSLFGSVRPTIISRQTRLLQKCIENKLDLSEVLSQSGLTYEDLRYNSDVEEMPGSKYYVSLEKFIQKKRRIPLVSFFSGCGGLDLGFEAAGFEHVASVEVNALFASTLKLNRPRWKLIAPPAFKGDMNDTDSVRRDLKNEIGISSRFDGIFIGGPPCQPFSIASNQRFSKKGKNFKRTGFAHTSGNLLFRFLELLIFFKPRAFLIENVVGLRDIDDGRQMSTAFQTLREAGYQMAAPLQINAANYSVPQFRERLFIIGSRTRNEFVPPLPASRIIPCGSALGGIHPGCKNHETRRHKAESILRYMQLDFGERDHLGRVDRLDPTIPSKTVIAGGTKGGGRSHLHPQIPRTLSVRESARLQTFPDDFVFHGPSARQFTQVGNAVPPVLAAQLATAIMNAYFS